MATSSLKTISSFSEDSIKLAISVSLVDVGERQAFEKSLKKVEQLLKQTVRDKSVASKKLKILPSAQIIFERNIIPRIREKLAEYELLEANGEVPVWNINLSYAQEEFSTKSLDELKYLHAQIVESEAMLHNYGLLISLHKGRLYLAVRSQIPNAEDVKTWYREELGVCYSQVNRFQSFALLVSKFPRLLIVGLSFSQFVKHNSRLITYLDQNSDLAERLANYINLTASEVNIDIDVVPDVMVSKIDTAFDPDDEFENYYDDPAVPNPTLEENLDFEQWLESVSKDPHRSISEDHTNSSGDEFGQSFLDACGRAFAYIVDDDSDEQGANGSSIASSMSTLSCK